MAAGLPSAVLVEIEFTAGAWTDVSSLVKGDSLEIHVGRDSAASGTQPGTLDLDLDNADGRFTPDNPTSTHYPNFVEGKRIRVRVTKSATTYVRFVGRITSLEPDFPTEPSQSVTHLAAVDILGDLARIALPSVQEGYARLNTEGQAAFYPLTDVNEHAGMSDVLGKAARLRIWDRTPGTGSIEARSDTSLFETRPYAVLKSGKGFYSTTPFPDAITFGVGVGNVAVIALVKVTSSSYGEVMRMSVGRCDVANDYNVLRWTSSGFILDTYISGALFGSSSSVAADDGWHHVDLRVDQFTIDGTSVGLGLSPSGNARHVSFGGNIDMSIGDALIFEDDTYTAIYSAGSVGLGARTLTQLATDLSTVTSAAGLSATFTWTTAPALNGAALLTEGRNALDVLVDLADSQSGLAYAVPFTSATQVVQLVATADARSATVALTLDAEGDLSGGPSMVRDIEGVVASATASSSAGTVTATDSTVTAVGAASVDVSTTLGDDNDLYAVATDRIARGRYQKLRLAVLAADLATATNDLYAAFFALTLGQRVRLSGLPSTYFGVTYMDCYVEGWAERPGITGYEVVFNLSPADAPAEAKFDDSTYGRFAWGDGVCTASSLTSSGTSVTLTWTGTATLSTSAGDYPMDIEIAGERCTISSAPAGGTSPRTVTIVRGVAPTVARAHSAGDAVDVWNAARFAL